MTPGEDCLRRVSVLVSERCTAPEPRLLYRQDGNNAFFAEAGRPSVSPNAPAAQRSPATCMPSSVSHGIHSSFDFFTFKTYFPTICLSAMWFLPKSSQQPGDRADSAKHVLRVLRGRVDVTLRYVGQPGASDRRRRDWLRLVLVSSRALEAPQWRSRDFAS